MIRVCVEVIGVNCRYCFELENCTTIQDVANKLVQFCGVYLDPESIVYVVNSRVVDASTWVCSDADVKIVRVLKGGGCTLEKPPHCLAELFSWSSFN